MFNKILFAAFLFTLMNCKSQKTAKDIDKKTDEIANNSSSEDSTKKSTQENLIYLKEGETKFLKDQKMNVTFTGITSDSRCPEDVKCIWAGAATASIKIMTTTSRPMQIELSTENLPSKSLTKSQNIAGYTISLEKVLPYPNQKNNTENLKGTYEIALKIEKTQAITTQ